MSCSKLGRSGPGCFQGSAPAPQQAAPPLHPNSGLEVSGAGVSILPRPRTGAPGGSGPAGTPRSRTSVLHPRQEQNTQTSRHQVVLMLFFSEVETIQEHGRNDQNVCVYKTLFRPMPLPRNGQEPGGPRAPAGAGYVQRAGQDPRGPPGKPGRGLWPPPPSRGGRPPSVLPTLSHIGSLLTPRAPRARGQTQWSDHPVPSGQVPPAWAWTRRAAPWESRRWTSGLPISLEASGLRWGLS